MISYAQNFEDVILARVFSEKRQGFYVDIGGMDPVLDSVTKHFYDLGWRGITVEPVRHLHARFERERSGDVNLRVAVGRERGRATFFEFEAAGISTLSADFADHFIRAGHRCTRQEVEILPLREICEAHCHGPIDFMKIDVEGFERDVLEGGDWSRFRPRVLVIEATRPQSSVPAWETWEPFVLQQDYLFAYFDGLNRFFVAAEERPLMDRLRLPPNIFDDFQTHEVARLQAELLEHQRAFTLTGFLPFVARKAAAKLRRGLRLKG
jgi:FkbM family methyltransferase